MKILFLSTWFPFPMDNGARIRVNYLLRSLAADHEVHLFAFLAEREQRKYLPELRSWCRGVQVVERDPFWRHPLKAKLGYFSSRPRDVFSSHCPEMKRLVEAAARQQSFDVTIASIANMAPYALKVGGGKRILEEHNFNTGWMAENYQNAPAGWVKAFRWLTWKKSQRYERQMFSHFDGCTMVSEPDGQAVRRMIPGYTGLLEVIPNGVDTRYHQPGLSSPARYSLVYNGSLNYYANWDAMRFFIADIFPTVRARLPDTCLTITGRYDASDLTHIQTNDAVKLTGFLEDIRPIVAGSWACIVPLRRGGGTRLKILQAMALGTPVIATSKGVEGLAVTPGWDILIADKPDEFAHQTVRLLQDEALRERLSLNGRKLVEARYGWDQIGRQFRGFVEKVARLDKRED